MREDKYLSQTAMECHAAAFGLTYKQVQGWFVGERRREKRENRTTELFSGRNGLGGRGATKVGKHCQISYKAKAPSSSRNNEKANHYFIQELLTPDYILKNVFRMDGPPLGVEFDSLPTRALVHSTACNENQRATKRGKVTEHAVISHQDCNESAPDAGDFPVGMGFANGEVASVSLTSTSVSRKLLTRNRRLQKKKLVSKRGRLQTRSQEKRKNFVKRSEASKQLNEAMRQVRGWFVETRRRKKRESRTTELFSGRNGLGGGGATRVGKHCQTSYKAKAPSLSRKNEEAKHNFIQELLTPDDILKKVFRMDGPPLGVEFDSLPSRTLFHSTACNENQRGTKRRKFTEHAVINLQDCNESAPVARDFPVGMGFANGEVASVSLTPTSVLRKLLTRNRRLQQKKLVPKRGRLQNRSQEKRKNFVKRREEHFQCRWCCSGRR